VNPDPRNEQESIMSTQLQTAQNTAVATSPSAAKAGQQAAATKDSPAIVPRVDVLEDQTGITLLADLPGVRRDQLDLKVDGDTLWIEGTVDTQAPEGLAPVHMELRVPRYRRAFTLSRELDPSGIQANLKDGVLNLRIPKQAHAQPRRIQVQVH
jgi:HSP20 family molecular chaperone IbpA